jgi:hypothetical protein
MNKRTLITFLLIPGLAGALLFFPWPFPGNTLCLADFLMAAPMGANHGSDAPHMPHMQAARDYLFPFGLLWWASLTLVACGVSQHRRKRIVK